MFARFVAQFRARSAVEIAIEPRHASWFTDDVEQMLSACRIARVAADPARASRGDVPGGWDGLVYYRWHGAPRVYYSSYEPAQLATVAASLARARVAERQCWFIFDNTAAGAALGNALALSHLMT